MKAVRRLALAAAMSVPLFGVLGLVAAPAASAHPLGNFTVNHYDGILLSPGHVRVTYVLDMAEIPTFQQKATIDADGDGTITPAERQAWAAAETATVLSQLSLTVDGRQVALSSTCGATMDFRPGQGGLPILRMVATLDGALPASGAVAFRDGSFDGRIGWKEVTANAAGGVEVSGSSVPGRSASDELLKYPVDLLSNPLAVTSASLFYATSGADAGAPACPGAAAGTPRAASNAFASLITWRLTPPVLLLSLLLAFVFGVVHALGPGHGKTITAAYLVGAGAKPRQAVGVGLAVALMHTASVMALGLAAEVLSSSFPYERIYPWLTVATGAVALTLGATMLLMRLRTRRSGADWHGHTHPWDHAGAHAHGGDGAPADAHVHAGDQSFADSGGAVATLVREGPHAHGSDLGDDHDHDEDHRHDGPASGDAFDEPVSRPRLAALAVAGGILPSPTALVVLLAAFSAHRIGYGLGLIVAFSVGLAAALIAIGVLALRTRAVVSRRLGSRVGAVIPILSALVIVGFGLFFLIRGALQVSA